MRKQSFEIRLLQTACVLLVVLCCSLQSAKAQTRPAAEVLQPQTSIFTYQGRLTDASSAANGTYQMQFALYDAASGGTQIGSTVTNPNVDVSAGVFAVQLDFGTVAFNAGSDRYLEIAVKRLSDAAYTTLSPRQQLTAAPFAVHTISASAADSLSSACIACVSDTQIGSVGGNKVSGSVAHADNATTAGTVTGVVAVANGGTGSSAQNFVDLSTNQTNIGGNKTFTGLVNGTFSGDGSGLNNVPAKFPWQVIAGTSQQAQPNTGYLLTNNNQVTVTLPAAPNVGDIVRVSGTGTGGWRISQNAGQSILGTNLDMIAAIWTARGPFRSWQAVASSADGSKLGAVIFDGQIYTSADAGVNWLPRDSVRKWMGVASSADGSKLVAVVQAGQIYTSTDSGLSWTARESNRNWSGVASSADGSKLVAVVQGGQIYTSTDSGVSWTARDSNRQWSVAASSADGSKLLVGTFADHIYTSTDSGVSWQARGTDALWGDVASSADGTRLVAVATNGQIYTSADSGVNWTARDTTRQWSGVASSTDGTRLVAVVSTNGQIYTSADSGASWTARETNRDWRAVASSADGSKLVAAVGGGFLYTSSPMTTLGTGGYLLGAAFAQIELLYLGNGQFLPLSHEGAILGN